MAKQTYTIGQVLTAAQMTTLQANDYNQTVSAKVASYVLVAADAGTRITMSNASATTVTVNTALFTAGDTLMITNIGAGVCTITAGSATVSTAGSLALNQYDSGTLYFTSTGVSIWNGANPGDITAVTAGTGISGGGTSGAVTVTNSMATTITTNGDILYGTGSGTVARLGIGSSAQVLVVAAGVPSWATPATSAQKVIQVVSASYATSTSSSSASYIDTGLTATITPTLNTSKILVLLAQNGAYKDIGATTGAIGLKLLRAGSDIAQITTNGLYTDTNMMLYGSSYALTYLDSPATTSATIYKTQFQRSSGLGNATVQINSSVSTITLLEIGA